MKILLSLHNQQINPKISSLDLYFPLQTNQIDEDLKDVFFSQLGKQIHLVRHQLLKNEDYIGISQNKRLFTLLQSDINKIYSLLENNDVLAVRANIYKPIFKLQEQNGIYDRILSNNNPLNQYYKTNTFNTLKSILTDKEYQISMNTNFTYAHNMFISTKNIFYNYTNFLNEKILKFKNSDLYKTISNDKNIINYNKKQGAWLGQFLLTIFCIQNNLKVYQITIEG